MTSPSKVKIYSASQLYVNYTKKYKECQLILCKKYFYFKIKLLSTVFPYFLRQYQKSPQSNHNIQELAMIRWYENEF